MGITLPLLPPSLPPMLSRLIHFFSMTSSNQASNSIPLRSLLERCRCLNNSAIPTSIPSGQFILHLPFVSLRSKQNPTLATATKLANALNLPVVTLFLSIAPNDAEESCFVTPRKMAFGLEAMTSVSGELEDLGVSRTYFMLQAVTTTLLYNAILAALMQVRSDKRSERRRGC